jgi:acyl-ACP thioesterase
MYTVKRKLLSEDVGPDRKLKLSRLLSFAQELSIAHTTELGMGRHMTLDRDLLWVIGRQRYIFNRLPEYDEDTTLSSWPGMTLKALFPRYYEFKVGDEVVIKGVAIWSLIKKKSRKVIFADKYGIIIPMEKYGGELPFPTRINAPKFKKTALLTANWSNSDLNGHLNNTYYMDFIESLIPVNFLKKHSPKSLDIDYEKEIKVGQTVEVKYGKKDNYYYFTSDYFTIRIGF